MNTVTLNSFNFLLNGKKLDVLKDHKCSQTPGQICDYQSADAWMKDYSLFMRFPVKKCQLFILWYSSLKKHLTFRVKILTSIYETSLTVNYQDT